MTTTGRRRTAAGDRAAMERCNARLAGRAARLPIAAELLAIELERLERDHYSTMPPFVTNTCDGCIRAMAVKAELKLIKGATK